MTQAHNEALNAQLKQGGAGLPVPETVGEASLMLPGRDAPVTLRVLRGTAGVSLRSVDGKSQPIYDSGNLYIEPQDGNSIKLTIDATIQEICERHFGDCDARQNVLWAGFDYTWSGLRCGFLLDRWGYLRKLFLRERSRKGNGYSELTHKLRSKRIE